MTRGDGVIRACRVCLSPTRTQERALACWFGHARRGGTPISVDLSRIFAGVERSKSRSWLAETLRDLDAAYRNAFTGGTRLRRGSSPATVPSGCASPSTSATGLRLIHPADTGSVRGCGGEEESSIAAEPVAVSYYVRLTDVGLTRIGRAA